jgi:hypothetical protein
MGNLRHVHVQGHRYEKILAEDGRAVAVFLHSSGVHGLEYLTAHAVQACGIVA